MRLLSFANLFFFFALIMVLHGKLIHKRNANGILSIPTNNNANGDQEAVSNTDSLGTNRIPARIRNRYHMFGKK
ncbi:unnamed protein product [Rotaria sp. Silwood2]|nr:unnamed protein product [Rotaria sp. Silwood2]CAF2500155.1 unnamed protein product [Rotaria sp. Silwood2]CAF2730545.1 unnamed protein product [Rotaria sp. Silwood2]CAF3947615.1 unnamed protein product [Rotaria sp. Silwood2]CAF3962637.1 unnamed protein product [Rotaria sp. Silwood2]